MKVVILAGGLGTRLSEETVVRPKPMVEIGGMPVLWHIMKIYSHWGINDFIVCLGYKGYLIKEYFANYALHMSDVTFDLQRESMTVHRRSAEPWRVTLVDTGDQTQTGGRIARVRHHLAGEKTFALTYGDGLADIDVPATIRFHEAHGGLATVTAVHPAKRFGALSVTGDRVVAFKEKPEGEGGFINGGFFILSTDVIDLIAGDSTIWEHGPLEALSRDNKLFAYRHPGFWHAMDTLRDKTFLEGEWSSGRARWKLWA